MREILFRGKRIDNGEWIQGDLVQFPTHGIVRIVEQEPSYKDAEVDLDTVGQYTGLTDKNGRKIFEGDCFKTYCAGLPVYKHIVGYYPEHFAFMARCIEMNTVHYLSDYRPSAIEVIGNIHDNPELLAMARDPDPPKREPEHKEPTILWTVGNLCVWKGKLCKIERFDTTSNNQTVVHLRREGLGYGLCVPIEELEEKE